MVSEAIIAVVAMARHWPGAGVVARASMAEEAWAGRESGRLREGGRGSKLIGGGSNIILLLVLRI